MSGCRRAMPGTPRLFTRLGSVSPVGDGFKAHVQYRDDQHAWVNIRGPQRNTKERADKDLARMREAALKGGDRQEGFELMNAEARILRAEADYEADIQVAMLHRAQSAKAHYEDEDNEYDNCSDYEYDDWLEEEAKKGPDKETPVATPLSQRVPVNSPIEATAALFEFRPGKQTVEDLKYLLDAKADPNSPTPDERIRIFANVMAFANEQQVGPMREALLQAGMHETDADRARWKTRQRCDIFDFERRQVAHCCKTMC